MIQPTLRASELRPGDPIPPLERTIDLVRMVAYAGATWDWHRLHYDPVYAAQRGIERPVVDGQMIGALLAEALMDWLGPRAFIRKLSFRLRTMVFAGDTVRCDGEIEAVADEDAGSLVKVIQRVSVAGRLVADASAEAVLPR